MTAGIGQAFMEQTRYASLEPSDQSKRLPQPPFEMAPSKPVLEAVDLPPPVTIRLGDLPLRQAIDQRQSLRTYADRSLTLKELSYLLWCTQGVKEITSRTVTIVWKG
jgi:hypothetical protein